MIIGNGQLIDFVQSKQNTCIFYFKSGSDKKNTLLRRLLLNINDSYKMIFITCDSDITKSETTKRTNKTMENLVETNFPYHTILNIETIDCKNINWKHSIVVSKIVEHINTNVSMKIKINLK